MKGIATFCFGALFFSTVSIFCQEIKQDAIFVRFRETTQKSKRLDIVKAKGSSVVREHLLSGSVSITIPKGKSVQGFVDEFNGLPDVIYAEPILLGEFLATQKMPNDSFFAQQWGLNQATDIDIDAPEAWNITMGSGNVVIAILDSGIDGSHPELSTGVGSRILQGWDFVDNDSFPEDVFGHGTHVAGIAGAESDNFDGMTGVCWNCKIMPIRVGKTKPVDTAVSDGIMFATNYAVNNQKKLVINLSLSVYDPQNPLQPSQKVIDAIEYAVSNGAIVVAASGNLGFPVPLAGVQFPASLSDNFSGVVAVGASTQNDTRRGTSLFGPELNIMAPGECILATYPTYLSVPAIPLNCSGFNISGPYRVDNGTSFATPHVSGLAGLILSQNEFGTRKLTPSDVRRIIEQTADDIGAPGFDNETGWGRINAFHALDPLAKEEVTITPADQQIDVTKGETVQVSYKLRFDDEVSVRVIDSQGIVVKEYPFHSGFQYINPDNTAKTFTLTWDGTGDPSYCISAAFCDVVNHVNPGNYVIQIAEKTYAQKTEKTVTVLGQPSEIVISDVQATPDPFDPTLPQQALIRASFNQQVSWTLQIFQQQSEGTLNEVKAFSGSGETMSQAWDGRGSQAYNGGNIVPFGEYLFAITASTINKVPASKIGSITLKKVPFLVEAQGIAATPAGNQTDRMGGFTLLDAFRGLNWSSDWIGGKAEIHQFGQTQTIATVPITASEFAWDGVRDDTRSLAPVGVYSVTFRDRSGAAVASDIQLGLQGVPATFFPTLSLQGVTIPFLSTKPCGARGAEEISVDRPVQPPQEKLYVCFSTPGDLQATGEKTQLNEYLSVWIEDRSVTPHKVVAVLDHPNLNDHFLGYREEPKTRSTELQTFTQIQWDGQGVVSGTYHVVVKVQSVSGPYTQVAAPVKVIGPNIVARLVEPPAGKNTQGFPILSGQLDIFGEASGQDFQSYEIAIAKGAWSVLATHFETLHTSTTPNSLSQLPLFTWDTRHVDDGIWTIRLKVNTPTGSFVHDHQVVEVRNHWQIPLTVISPVGLLSGANPGVDAIFRKEQTLLAQIGTEGEADPVVSVPTFSAFWGTDPSQDGVATLTKPLPAPGQCQIFPGFIRHEVALAQECTSGSTISVYTSSGSVLEENICPPVPRQVTWDIHEVPSQYRLRLLHSEPCPAGTKCRGLLLPIDMRQQASFRYTNTTGGQPVPETQIQVEICDAGTFPETALKLTDFRGDPVTKNLHLAWKPPATLDLQKVSFYQVQLREWSLAAWNAGEPVPSWGQEHTVLKEEPFLNLIGKQEHIYEARVRPCFFDGTCAPYPEEPLGYTDLLLPQEDTFTFWITPERKEPVPKAKRIPMELTVTARPLFFFSPHLLLDTTTTTDTFHRIAKMPLYAYYSYTVRPLDPTQGWRAFQQGLGLLSEGKGRQWISQVLSPRIFGDGDFSFSVGQET